MSFIQVWARPSGWTIMIILVGYLGESEESAEERERRDCLEEGMTVVLVQLCA